MSGLWYCSLCGQGQQVQVAPIGFEGEELCGGCHTEAVWSSRVAERDERIAVLETQLRYAAKAPESPADVEAPRHPWLAKEEKEPAAQYRRVGVDLSVGDLVRRKRDGQEGVVVFLPTAGYVAALVRWGQPGLAESSIVNPDELEVLAPRPDSGVMSEARYKALKPILEWVSASLKDESPYLAEIIRRWYEVETQTRADVILLMLDGIDDYDRAEILRVAGGAS